MGQTCSKGCRKSDTSKKRRKKKRPKTAELTNESDQTEMRWYRQILVDEDVLEEDEELPSHEQQMMSASKINVISDTKSVASVRSVLKGANSSNYSPATSMHLEGLDNGSSSPRWAVATRPVDHSSNVSNQSVGKPPPRVSSVSVESSAGGMTTTSQAESQNLPTYYPSGQMGGPSDISSDRSTLGLTPHASSANLEGFSGTSRVTSGVSAPSMIKPDGAQPTDECPFEEGQTANPPNIGHAAPLENYSMTSIGVPNSSTTTGPGSSITTVREISPALGPNPPTGERGDSLVVLNRTSGLNASQTSSQGAMGLSSVQLPQGALNVSTTSFSNPQQINTSSSPALGVLNGLTGTRQQSPCPAPDMNSMFVPFGGATSPEPGSGGLGNASLSAQNACSTAGYSSSNVVPQSNSISGSQIPPGVPLHRPPAHLSQSVCQSHVLSEAPNPNTTSPTQSSVSGTGQVTPGVVTTSPNTMALVHPIQGDIHSDVFRRQQTTGRSDDVVVSDTSLEIAAEIHMPQPQSRQHSTIHSHNDSPRANGIPHWDQAPAEGQKQYSMFAPPVFNGAPLVEGNASDRASASSHGSTSSRGIHHFNLRNRKKSVSFADCDL